MKILSRDFTFTEKILLLVLALILICLAYYQFVYVPVTTGIEEAHAERDALQIELIEVQAKAQNTLKMQRELESLSLEDISLMPSYNNSEAAVASLNEVLSATWDYVVYPGVVTRNSDQIRRHFSIMFRTSDLDHAKNILEYIAINHDRCLIGDITYTEGVEPAITQIQGTGENAREVVVRAAYNYVEVHTDVTFYETMVGGTPDLGLPEDSDLNQAPS